MSDSLHVDTVTNKNPVFFNKGVHPFSKKNNLKVNVFGHNFCPLTIVFLKHSLQNIEIVIVDYNYIDTFISRNIICSSTVVFN